jgi:hypothetical protein
MDSSEFVFTSGISARFLDTSIPMPLRQYASVTHYRCAVAPTMAGNGYRLSRARDVPALARVASMQGRVLRPSFRGIRIRLRELVDCHLKAAKDHRGHTNALRFLGRIVEHVLECSDVGSISHMFLRTISHKLLKKIVSSDARYYFCSRYLCSRSLLFTVACVQRSLSRHQGGRYHGVSNAARAPWSGAPTSGLHQGTAHRQQVAADEG